MAAFGGGRFLLVSPSTGKAIAWTSSTGRWARVHPLPALGVVSASWTGRAFLVAAARQLRVNVGIVRVFALAGSRWTALPSLPQPPSGRIAEAVPTASGDSVYALVSDAVWHTNPNDQYVSGSVRLVRLAASSWIPVLPGLVCRCPSSRWPEPAARSSPPDRRAPGLAREWKRTGPLPCCGPAAAPL